MIFRLWIQASSSIELNIFLSHITVPINTLSKPSFTLRIFAYKQLITKSQFSICAVNES